MKSFAILLLSALCAFGQAYTFNDPNTYAKPSAMALTNGIISYWRLDDTAAGGLDDQRGNLHPLLTVDTTTTIAGIITNALQTSAQSLAYVSNSASANLMNAGAGVSFTIAGWWRPFENPTTGDGIWCKKWHPSTAADQQWKMGLSGTYANPAFTVNNTAGTTISVTNTIAFPDDGVWRHIAFGFDSPSQVIWIQVNANTRQTAACTEVRTGSQEIVMLSGNQGATSLGSGPAVRGDEIGIWQRSLSSAEVVRLYSGGWALDYPFYYTRCQQLVGYWSDQVVANGGAAISIGTSNSCCTFLDSLVSSGVSSKMLVINPIAPDSLIAASTPLIQGPSLAFWVNHNFVGGDVGVNGITGNGSTKYMETGIVPSTEIGTYASGIGITSYTYQPATSNTVACVLGSNPVTFEGNSLALHVRNNNFITWWCPYGTGSASSMFLPYTNWFGYLSGNRTGASVNNFYGANSTNAHAALLPANTTSPAGSPGATPMVFMARNDNGAITEYTSGTISFLAVHRGLSTNESFAFFNAIQTLRTNLGGGYR